MYKRQGIYSYWDVMITDSIVKAAGSEANAGAWDAYSFGIYAEENINISSGSVNVFGGSAECASDPETAASLGTVSYTHLFRVPFPFFQGFGKDI